MKASGHEGVAKDVGLSLLKEAFGEDKNSLDAFYLGNWLTDVSQVVDPVAYEGARDGGVGALDALTADLGGVVDTVFDGLFHARDIAQFGLDDEVLQTLRETLEDVEDQFVFAEARAEIKKSLEAAVTSLFMGATGGRESRLGLMLRQVFYVIGYFKFVHPEGPGGQARMRYDAYRAVFGEPDAPQGDRFESGSEDEIGRKVVELDASDRPGGYTQYYPHEHLDRPVVGPGDTDFAPGPQKVNRHNAIGPTPGGSLPGKTNKPGPRAISNPSEVRPDLYSYLRDHMECTAGLLAEVDDAMARALEQGFDDADPAWHQTLAKAGHALHQVEDFFAHSNWAELAATQMGAEFRDQILAPRLGIGLLDTANDIFDRRLRRYVNTVGKMSQAEFDRVWNERETWVVTGYYDKWDTLISILHMGEAAFGLEAHDPTEYVHDRWESLKGSAGDPSDKVDGVKEVLKDTLDFVSDPEGQWDNDDNSVAKRMKEPYDEWIKSVTTPMLSERDIAALCRDIPLLKGAAPEVLQVFVNTIILGTRVDALKEPVQPLWDAWKELRDFLSRPYAYIIEKLTGFLTDKLKAVARNLVLFYGKDALFEALGSKRIGSHSLLSKDHGNELLYPHARECAAAVHWYVVHTLLRDRSADGVPEHIDWLELLEHFLANPLAAEEGSRTKMVRVEVMAHRLIVTHGGDQLDSPVAANSLTERYARSAAPPYRLTWRDIADTNFGTQDLSDEQCRAVVNARLRASGQGVPVAKPNYAFRPGVPLFIPYQLVTFAVPVADEAQPAWWRRVISEKDWKVLRGREEKQFGLSTAPYAGHVLQPFTATEHAAQIARGRNLRRMLRSAYRPKAHQGRKLCPATPATP